MIALDRWHASTRPPHWFRNCSERKPTTPGPRPSTASITFPCWRSTTTVSRKPRAMATCARTRPLPAGHLEPAAQRVGERVLHQRDDRGGGGPQRKRFKDSATGTEGGLVLDPGVLRRLSADRCTKSMRTMKGPTDQERDHSLAIPLDIHHFQDHLS